MEDNLCYAMCSSILLLKYMSFILSSIGHKANIEGVRWSLTRA